MKQAPYTATIIKRKDITRDLFCLWLQVEGDKDFAFKPGQYCAIGFFGPEGEPVLDDRGRPLFRPYSIVSAPHEKEIELFIELVQPPDGNLTPLLYNLKIGDTVPLLPRAKGVFTFEPKYKNHVMVATVTGIAPFISMIRDYMLFEELEGNYNFFVLQGASYYDEFCYDNELRDIELWTSTSLVYLPTVSRPNEARNASWRGEIGRVNLIVEDFLERLHLSQEDTIIYACGHTGMVNDVESKFGVNGKGFRVKAELYW